MMTSPQKNHNKRKSLRDLFDNIDLSLTKSTKSNKSVNRKMYHSLGESLRSSGWPFWESMKWSQHPPKPCKFTLRLSSSYRSYSEDLEAPEVIFERSSAIITELQSLLISDCSHDALLRYTKFTTESMTHAIFGSNMQERAGLDLATTIRICMEIFDGAEIDAAKVEPRSPEYQAALELLRSRGIRDPDSDHVIRSRREVIQHAQAMQFLFDAMLNRNEPLSEKLILDTHRILCHGISKDPQDPRDSEYAGRYRTIDVMAGGTAFTAWKNVPREIRIFIDDFNSDVRDRETSGDMDPFYLAADVCQDFVTIHPFEDGNGRMCRLLLNAFLMKYCGIVVAIGEHDDDREQYLKIAEEAGDGDTEESARGKLARFVLGKGIDTLKRLKERLEVAS